MQEATLSYIDDNLPRIRQLAAVLLSDEWPRDPSLGPLVLPGDVVDPHPGMPAAAAAAAAGDNENDAEGSDSSDVGAGTLL